MKTDVIHAGLGIVLGIAAVVSPVPAAATTVIVVRHAEKVDDSCDPALRPAGQARARALAEMLADAGLDAVYASQYQRTRLTAEPAAKAAAVEVIVEPVEGDIKAWAAGFARELIARHSGETALVVGHSNTFPAVVTVLCRCEIATLDESDYDRVFLLHMLEQGAQPRFDLIRARFGVPGAAPSAHAKTPLKSHLRGALRETTRHVLSAPDPSAGR